MITEASKTRYFWHITLALLALAMLVIHPVKAFSKTAYLEGTATYMERMALPPKAVLEVRLVETMKNSRQGKVIAKSSERIRSSVPVKFRLKYNDKKIQRGHQYVLQADIKIDGRVWFTTNERYTVLERDQNTNLILQRVSDEERHTQKGVIFGGWVAVSLDGKPVTGKEDIKMQVTKDGKLSGFSGCNRYFGEVDFRDNAFKTSRMGVTRMACLDRNIANQERRLFDVFDTASAYRLAKGGKELNLLDNNGRTVAVFKR